MAAEGKAALTGSRAIVLGISRMPGIGLPSCSSLIISAKAIGYDGSSPPAGAAGSAVFAVLSTKRAALGAACCHGKGEVEAAERCSSGRTSGGV